MNTDDAAQDLHLVIRPLPDAVPAAVRVRRWLKNGLRVWGLRCLSLAPARVEENPAGKPTREDLA